MRQNNSSLSLKEYLHNGLKVVIPLLIVITISCGEYNNDTPIIFSSYLSGYDSSISISELKLFTSKQALNFYAVMEVKKLGPAGEEIYIQKEWYKKPGFFRRETISLGMLPQIFIKNGHQSWSYVLFDNTAVHNKSFDFLDEPMFYIYKISEIKLKELIQSRVISISEDEYLLNERKNFNNITTISQIWLDHKTMLPKRWYQKVYNEENVLIQENKCDLIEYNIDLSDRLFKLSKGIKQLNDEYELEYQGEAKQEMQKLVLDDEYNIQLLDYEKNLEIFQKRYLDNPQVYIDLGNIALMKGNVKKAEELFKLSIEKDNKNKQGYISLINVYLSNGIKDQAKKTIDRYKEMVSAVSAYDYYILGIYYEKADSFEEAVSMYKLAIDLQPDDVYTNQKSGMSITEKGLRNKFIDAYKAASSKLHNKLKS